MKILSIKHVTLLLVTLFTFTLGYAQVGIGTTDIDASAVLELDATDKALLLPRVANTAAMIRYPPHFKRRPRHVRATSS